VGLAESNGSLLLGLELRSRAGCLPWKPEISTSPYGPVGTMMMMMMMMMMSGFVERVINSPQTRCRSAKQVGLQMSSERQRGKSCCSQSVALPLLA